MFDCTTKVAGAEVEFEVETEESGKLKAINVTAPGGASLKPPPRRERRPKRDDAEKSEPPKQREPPFHTVIKEELKEKIEQKGLELGEKITIDVKLGGARIKLGQGGYTALAHADGLVGEGTFVCDQDGTITFTWERALENESDSWKSCDVSKLMASLSLVEDDVAPVGADETAETLWGPGKDPSSVLSEHEFKMKRIVLTRPPGSNRRPRRKKG